MPQPVEGCLHRGSRLRSSPAQTSHAPSDDTDGSLLDVLFEICDFETNRLAGWDVESTPVQGGREANDRSQWWVVVHNDRSRTPNQGWKLHVSAGLSAAEEVLRRAVPVLMAEGASFKVAASLLVLGSLNHGEGGSSQIGKFITVYPESDEQAVRLASLLDRATRGLRGPRIPSDRRLTPDSLVHYRYGSFGDRFVQLPLGLVVPAIEDPRGELVPDLRISSRFAPEWQSDPFREAGIARKAPARLPLIGGRYLLAATIYRSPRGMIHLAADIRGQRNCVLKQAPRDALIGADGRDARDRLRHESSVLRTLAGDPRFPEPFDLIEDKGDLFLAMEDVEGDTLEEYVGEIVAQGRCVPGDQIVAWGRDLAAALGAVHAKGIIYRDLKSPNVIVGPDGRLRLVDFELAFKRSEDAAPFGTGTRGYSSPQQQNGERPGVTDDVYSLGAILYFAATGAEPSLAPNASALLERPLALLNPQAGAALSGVIARCLDPDPAERFQSMAALDGALARVDPGATVPPRLHRRESPPPSEDVGARCRVLARELGDAICNAAEERTDPSGRRWLSTHHIAAGVPCLDINTGGAGTLLALAELAGELGEPVHLETLREAAYWLTRGPGPEGPPLPGLYVGQAGIGAALLRASQVLGDDELLAAAVQRGQRIASMRHTSPDLFNGTAGRLRFHLLLYDETGDGHHVDAALAAGQSLLDAAEPAGGRGLRWSIPDGFGSLSGSAYLGYAHGAAGIGDALLDLVEVVDDRRFREAAQGAGRWLTTQARPVLDDEAGLDWPNTEGEPLSGAFWCRGATGVGRFFLHAEELGIFPGAADLAARAATTVARGARAIGPTQCHGLAGSIEFLLDVHRATGEIGYLADAQTLTTLLEAFASRRNGSLVWPSESPATFSPDYLVGYAGVAVCLLRMSDPAGLPHQLSRQGFRRQGPYHRNSEQSGTSGGREGKDRPWRR